MKDRLVVHWRPLSLAAVLLLGACAQQAPLTPPVATPAPAAPLANKRADLYAAPAMAAPAAVGMASMERRAIIMPPEYRPPVQNTEQYGQIQDNPVHVVAREPVSTFSIDVDTGSYANVRRFLNNGRLPPVDAVRVEELINYFPYDYARPADSRHPFGVSTEVAQSPWKNGAELLRIAIQAADQSFGSLPPANLVFLVDVSGSMQSEDKLPLVKKTLRQLVDQLRPQDRVTLITYASGEQLVLPPTPGNQRDTLLRAINSLQAGGATAGEQAMQLAYREAERAYIRGGINRILLATDGDFNVGITDFATLRGMVAEKRKSGISLTTLGYGQGNYNERLMEQLADAGDGNYSYIDTEREAKKVLRQQLSSTLATVASDVKLQVEFNPATVSQYRLIGYENRMLRQEDFQNDQVDAGEIGAGHAVTALYEIIPAGRQGWLGDSRYQPAAAAATAHGQEYAYVNIRYKPVGKSASTLLSVPVPVGSRPLAQSSTDMRFATAVASYGQQLRGGRQTGNFGWKDTLALAKVAQGQDPFGLRAEFVELVETAASLSSRQPDGSAPPPDLRPQPLPRPVPVKPIPIPRPVLPMPPQPY